jgi:glutathione S-transferase
MRLFQFPYSPFALKVQKCLQLKGLPFEVVDVPYLDRRELMAVSGGLHIPVLQDNERTLSGSQEITLYLDATYSPSLRPPHLVAAATVFEQWAESALEDVAFRLAAPGIEENMAAWNNGRQDARAFWTLIKERKYGPGCIEAWRIARAGLKLELDELLAPLERTLAVQPFLLGDLPTLADAAVWGQVEMIERVSGRQGLGLLPGMSAWHGRLLES